MPNRRILSLWFPRLGAERLLRQERGLPQGPLAIVRTQGNAQALYSLSPEAEAQGLRVGQPLRDAMAMCPTLVTRLSNPQVEQAFLVTLRRWAGKYSPWVSDQPPASLMIDITGSAHLFGGETALLEQIQDDCIGLSLSAHAGIADTVGAAWALARFAGQPVQMARTGDSIDQEAYATRSRAVKRRHWERGGPTPQAALPGVKAVRIAAPGKTRIAISGLPIAALRLDDDTVSNLTRLGLRRIGDLIGTPRASLARRFGKDVVHRLDQALGVEPEPVSPVRAAANFAVRLTLPDPIGLESDILAGIDRLLPALAANLRQRGHGARRVRLQLSRSDQTTEWFEIGLARASDDPERIRPLLAMQLAGVDAGFGIDMLRLEAYVTEPLRAQQHRGHLDAANRALEQITSDTSIDDLIGKLGARIGLDHIIRLHPADSHIPEKTSKTLAAAWSEPVNDWQAPAGKRPLVLWRPEYVSADDSRALPLTFRWRRRQFETLRASGPERIAPEWWLDEPDWRSGVRDYWRVTCHSGEQLWLYYAHGGTMSPGWFCQARFA